MQVTAWSNGRGIYGIRVGSANRNAFFRREWQQITVEMGGAPRTFKLTAGFWRDCPEFRDFKESWIEQWLRLQSAIPWPQFHPPEFQLIPTGENTFRLET